MQRPAVAGVAVGGVDHRLDVGIPAAEILFEILPRVFDGPRFLGNVVGLDAADGGGGDYYAQWFDGENAALLILFEGDTERDTEELRSALLDYARTGVAEEDWAWVEVFDGRLAFIAADQPEVGETILASVGG